MKKILVFSLFSFIFFSAFAIKDKKQKDEKPLSKLSLGINFSPDLAYRVTKSDGSQIGNNVKSSDDYNEIPKFGYTVGINTSYHFNKHIAFEIGIQYSNKGYKTRRIEPLIFPQQNDTTYNPYFPTGIAGSIQFTYNYHYLDIPLKVNLTYGKGKIKFIGSAGIALNVLLSATSSRQIKYYDGSSKTQTLPLKPSTTSFQKINISPMISAGIDCSLTKHLSLKVEPTFRFGIIKLSNTPVSDYLYNAGLNTSLYWNF